MYIHYLLHTVVSLWFSIIATLQFHLWPSYLISWHVIYRDIKDCDMWHKYSYIVAALIPYSKYFSWGCNFRVFCSRVGSTKNNPRKFMTPEQVSKVIISITFNFRLNKQANLVCASNLIYNPQQFLHSSYCIFQWLSVLPNWIPSSAVVDGKAKRWPSTKAFSSYCSSYCSLSLSVCPTQQ